MMGEAEENELAGERSTDTKFGIVFEWIKRQELWEKNLPTLKAALWTCLAIINAKPHYQEKAQFVAQLVREVIASKEREAELEQAREANRIAAENGRRALYVSWAISIAAVLVSAYALVQENPLVPEAKALREEVAGLKGELEELRKLEAREDYLILVPGNVGE